MSEHIFEAEYDEEGVWVYQAFRPDIAEPAVESQSFEDTPFDIHRMTWIKPSFAWMLYRSKYGTKHNQECILKIKVAHQVMASLLNICKCKDGGGGSFGRVQWDPARDLYSQESKKHKIPRKKLRDRTIQIGLKEKLNQLYTSGILEIKDVTELAHAVSIAHQSKNCGEQLKLLDLPNEKQYIPHCSKEVLTRLQIKHD